MLGGGRGCRLCSQSVRQADHNRQDSVRCSRFIADLLPAAPGRVVRVGTTRTEGGGFDPAPGLGSFVGQIDLLDISKAEGRAMNGQFGG